MCYSLETMVSSANNSNQIKFHVMKIPSAGAAVVVYIHIFRLTFTELRNQNSICRENGSVWKSICHRENCVALSHCVPTCVSVSIFKLEYHLIHVALWSHFFYFFLYWIIVIIEQKGNSWHIYGGENYCHPFYWK